MTQQARNFYCYGPRPRHVDLDPLPQAIYLVLRDAKGIFAKGGFTKEAIRNTLTRECAALQTALTDGHVLTELLKLKGLGLVEQLASAPERWRVKR